jgi:hypothetical protein
MAQSGAAPRGRLAGRRPESGAAVRPVPRAGARMAPRVTRLVPPGMPPPLSRTPGAAPSGIVAHCATRVTTIGSPTFRTKTAGGALVVTFPAEWVLAWSNQGFGRSLAPGQGHRRWPGSGHAVVPGPERPGRHCRRYCTPARSAPYSGDAVLQPSGPRPRYRWLRSRRLGRPARAHAGPPHIGVLIKGTHTNDGQVRRGSPSSSLPIVQLAATASRAALTGRRARSATPA